MRENRPYNFIMTRDKNGKVECAVNEKDAAKLIKKLEERNGKWNAKIKPTRI